MYNKINAIIAGIKQRTINGRCRLCDDDDDVLDDDDLYRRDSRIDCNISDDLDDLNLNNDDDEGT